MGMFKEYDPKVKSKGEPIQSIAAYIVFREKGMDAKPLPCTIVSSDVLTITIAELGIAVCVPVEEVKRAFEKFIS